MGWNRDTAPVAGVDGMRGGWIVAVVHGHDRVDWAVVPDAGTALAATTECAAVGVDVPIGLPDRGRRPCDVTAAHRLGTARSSVFPAPVAAVLDAPDYAAACRRARAVTGRAVSRQTWSLVPRIADWANALKALPAGGDRVVEVHPELSFRRMAPDVAFASKHSARGMGQRLAALREFVDAVVLGELPPGPALDDVLDALAAAWSAQRWACGVAEVLGGTPDVAGEAMRIVV